jgi:methyl-accepting chemotaxis protein
MQRLKLLPKFALITLLFFLPLVMATTMLFNELHHAISISRAERSGLRVIQQVHQVVDLARRHRTFQRMLLNHHPDAQALAQPVREKLDREMAKLASLQNQDPSTGDQALLQQLAQNWQAIKGRLDATNARESYAQHSDFINGLLRYGDATASRSHLSMDPGADSRLLVNLIMHAIPNLKERIAEMTGRGATIIDTGMFEANEDVMLNARLMLAQHELAGLPLQIDAIYRENPALDKQLDAFKATRLATAQFLERARLEVLNTVDQTSGKAFEEAGSATLHELNRFSAKATTLLDGLLVARIRQQMTRAAWMLAIMVMAMALAAYLLAGFYAAFRRDIDQLESRVVQAAEGDFSFTLRAEGSDELAHIVNAFGDMSRRLTALIANVQSGAMHIAAISENIATGNADLSARTQQQASSLQQTAASMEQLNTTVQQHAEQTIRVNQRSLEAAGRAADGGQSVSQVVDTMSDITLASRQIEDIIAVIDGIAFQTNILALNAAVEAARAGPHGRGFAVVAAEVRALAQRSALAATDVKALIQNSLGKVHSGNRLVEQTRLSMDAIVADIRHVSDIMGDMSAASREQSGGINQINTALTHMDQITQKNAALVEQLATDAALLHDLVAGLTQAVGLFKLAAHAESAFETEPASWDAKDKTTRLPALTEAPLVATPTERLRLKAAA